MNCSHCGAPSVLTIRTGGALFCRTCFETCEQAARFQQVQRDSDRPGRGQVRSEPFRGQGAMSPGQEGAVKVMEDLFQGEL